MDRELKLKVVFDALDRLSGPIRSIGENTKKMGARLGESRAEMKKLERAQAELGKFRELKSGLDSTEAKWREAERRAEALARAIGEVEQPTRKMQREFDRATREAGDLKQEFQEQERAAEELRRSLDKAGFSTRDMVDSERRLRSEIDRTSGEIDRQKDKLKQLHRARERGEDMQRLGSRMTGAGASAMAGGAALLAPIALVSREAVKLEDAMADVRKVVDGLESPEAFQQMSNDILALSNRIPLAKEQIAAIVQAGGQAGIARGELLGFAEDAAKMGVAFDTTGEQAGEMMAQWRTAFSMDRAGVTTLADQINFLGNTTAASTDKITDIVTRIGPLGQIGGLASGQIAALGATISGTGVSSEISATGVKNLMLALTKGEAATKSQAAAFEALGLNATAVAKSMQEDAGGTILSVLEKLRALPREAQAGMLTELFGSESVAAIAPLLTQLDTLEENFTKVGDAQRYAGSMEKEYQSRSATTSNALQLAKNNAETFAAVVGTTILPTLTILARKLGAAALWLSAFAQEHPELVKWIVMLMGGIGGLLLIFGPLLIGLGMMTSAFGRLQVPLRGLTGYFKKTDGISKFSRHMSFLRKVAGKSIGVLGKVGRVALLVGKQFLRAGLMMLANPMVLAIVALVAAIGIAAYLIYTHWDTIKAAFGSAIVWISAQWEGFKALLAAGWAYVSGLFASAGGWIAAAWQAIFAAFSAGAAMLGQAWEWIKGKFADGLSWLQALPNKMLALGSQIMAGLLNGLDPGKLADRLISIAKRGLAAFKNFFGIKSPSRVFMRMGGHLTEGLDRGEDAPVRRIARMGGKMARAWSAPVLALASPQVAGATDAAPYAPRGAVRPGANGGGPASFASVSARAGAALDRGSRMAAQIRSTVRERETRTRSPSAAPVLNFTVQQAPGQDPQDLAERIAEEVERKLAQLDRREQAARRSSYDDEE